MDMLALAQQCAPGVEQHLAVRLMRRESSFNPYAIGVVGGPPLKPQPQDLQTAVDAAENLLKAGKKFAVGVAQIHIDNIRTFKLTWRQAFDPCTNLSKGQSILKAFHAKALKAGMHGDSAVLAALRGYNSGSLYARVSDDYAAAILGNWRQAPSQSKELATEKEEARIADDADIFAALVMTGSAARDAGDGQSRDIFGE
jgi:type IV secretion system protein VirB1